jgi:hypothetical protein
MDMLIVEGSFEGISRFKTVLTGQESALLLPQFGLIKLGGKVILPKP